MPPKALDDFHSHLQEAIASRQMVKLTLSKTRKKNDSPKRVSIKPVALKAGLRYSFLYSYPTRDEVKNHLPEETVLKVEQLLEEYFLEANLFTISAQQSLILSAKGKGKLLSKKNEQTAEIKLSHDRSKNRLLDAAGLHWHLLGMTDTKGNVQASMQHKFKQINKYIEILDGLISPWLSEGPVKVVDMGAGKGYLTFALYEHLQAKNTLQPQVIGVEQRPELVVKTNAIAKNANMEGLTFEEGSIHNYPLKEVEILIALHACDTATDNAIAAGIAAGARLIVCAPCATSNCAKK